MGLAYAIMRTHWSVTTCQQTLGQFHFEIARVPGQKRRPGTGGVKTRTLFGKPFVA